MFLILELVLHFTPHNGPTNHPQLAMLGILPHNTSKKPTSNGAAETTLAFGSAGSSSIGVIGIVGNWLVRGLLLAVFIVALRGVVIRWVLVQAVVILAKGAWRRGTAAG